MKSWLLSNIHWLFCINSSLQKYASTGSKYLYGYTYSEIIRRTVIQADLGHKSRGTATSVELGQQKAGIWGLLLQTVFEGRKEVGFHKHCVDQKKIDVHVDFIHLFWNHRTVIQADLGHKSRGTVMCAEVGRQNIEERLRHQSMRRSCCRWPWGRKKWQQSRALISSGIVWGRPLEYTPGQRPGPFTSYSKSLISFKNLS